MNNDSYELAAICTANTNDEGNKISCLPQSSGSNTKKPHPLNHPHHHHPMTTTAIVSAVPTSNAAAVAAAASYQHRLNLSHQHHSPYSNNYHLHHGNSHQHIHTEQTKSLQELQHEVGALLEFRDLVIETFPDLKHKMASLSSSSISAAAGVGVNSCMTASVSSAITLTGNCLSGTSMASRREWEPGIRLKRKISHKEPSKLSANSSGVSTAATATVGPTVGGEMSSSSLSRSRSNSHSGKKEPKSGENNNGSVVQDSGFSTETSSSKEGHSASSTNGAMTGPIAHNRPAQPESDDELMNLLDVIHRKSNRIREEVEQLQNFERQNLHVEESVSGSTATDGIQSRVVTKCSSNSSSSDNSSSSGLTPKTFREHVERLNKEDIKKLRKERDRLLDKLAEMEAETLTGRIKAAKMNDQVEELISVKKDLEEQLKLAMAQKLELSSRVQQLQQQQQHQQQQQPQQHQHSKSSSSQSECSSSQRLNFLSSATTVLSTGSGATPVEVGSPTSSVLVGNPATPVSVNRGSSVTANTFQPVVVEHQDSPMTLEATKNFLAFHQSASSDSRQLQQPLGRLDGIVSTPGGRNTKCRVTDSKRFQAILLETNVIELQRHLLTLTVQNQVLAQKLEQSSKSKTQIVKRLEKSKEDIEDLKFQLEEKSIELEGTKAQLRVLESRMHSSTPTTSTSFMHSQHDYETNRSSASTTLMLSRRGGETQFCDSRSNTPISANINNILPAPTATQISTPSMKAMTHLPMDELQQHSSSTESTQDLQLDLPQAVSNKLMSASVGGTSPFATTHRPQQQSGKRLSLAVALASKPSKIPLPGSKTTSYSSSKPPTGRPSTAGRSPPSANTSTGSHASNSSSSKSSLSRSTGNLQLYSKSPNSLKRADSVQSIRKDVTSSLSTNTSRSSTSSIPMATTPYSSRTVFSQNAMNQSTPCPRVLQNSPLPKLKRDSLTSRVRHLDSLSRIHHHQQQQQNSNDSTNSSQCASHNNGSANSNGGSYLIASTPKTSIASQLSATMRKDLQLNNSAHNSQQIMRRAVTASHAAGASATTATTTTTRRFSSASAIGARIASGRAHTAHENLGAHNSSNVSNNSTSSSSTSSTASAHTASSGGNEQHQNAAHGADSDSGKKYTVFSNENKYFANNIFYNGSESNSGRMTWQTIHGNPIGTEQSQTNGNVHSSSQQNSHCLKWNKLQEDSIAKLRFKREEFQQRQNNYKHKFMDQLMSAFDETCHDYRQRSCVKQQQKYPLEQNQKTNNNKNRNKFNKVHNAFLIDASHVSFDSNYNREDYVDDVIDYDDDDDDNNRHKFHDYHYSTKGMSDEKEKATHNNELLVTFDYGFCDSSEHHKHQLSDDEFNQNIAESDYSGKLETYDEYGTCFGAEYSSRSWIMCSPNQVAVEAAQFPVHRMQHNVKDIEMSFLSTLTEYDVDEDIDESTEILLA